jgi:hypothetical protein
MSIAYKYSIPVEGLQKEKTNTHGKQQQKELSTKTEQEHQIIDDE